MSQEEINMYIMAMVELVENAIITRDEARENLKEILKLKA